MGHSYTTTNKNVFKCECYCANMDKRSGKRIVPDEGHMGSEKQARLVTAVADLDYYDVSPYREMTSHETSVMTDKELFQKEKWQNLTPRVAPLGVCL